MNKVIKDTDKEVYKMYDDAVQEEKDGRLIFFKRFYDNLSEKLLHQFVEYISNRRMKTIKLTPVYDQKSNPLPWLDHWLNSKGTQNNSTRNRDRKLCHWWNKTRRKERSI